MKKLLISIMIILTCILTLITALKGINVGKIEILGIQGIKEENANLEKKLNEATTLASTDYTNKISTINADVKAMKNEKQSYEDMVSVSTDSEVAASLQKQKYTVDKLWAKIGTLATDEGLDARFELKNGSLTPASTETFKYYDINFTVQGSYVGVSLYISDLEDDSELNFKIENFEMEPINNGESVKATFVTKDIAIEGISTSTVITNTNNGANNSTNTTDTANTTSSTNTTANTTSSTNTTANATSTTNATTNTTNTTSGR